MILILKLSSRIFAGRVHFSDPGAVVVLVIADQDAELLDVVQGLATGCGVDELSSDVSEAISVEELFT